MASAPSDPKPILGRIDASGRLVSADPELERLQVEAGSRVGVSLALPQIAAVARLAQRLGIPVARRVLAAGRDQDVDMWVRAVPDGGEVALTIEQWSARPASAPRLAAMAAVAHEQLAPEPLSWSVDEHLRLVAIAPALAELIGIDDAAAPGQALTKLFRLEADEDGSMPMLDALASRTAFSGQPVRAREGDCELLLSGEVLLGPDGTFKGFEGGATADASSGATAAARPPVDPTIQTALRSPLDNIVRSAEEMIDRSDSSLRPEYAAYAADIAGAARHLLSVIRALGDEAKGAGSDRVDVTDVAWEAVGLVEAAADRREIELMVEQGERLFARGDPRAVVQILVNLLGNAIRYSPEGTSVTVAFETTRDSVTIHVADEGPGIDEADRDRIFEPFEKAAEGGEGVGLGLSIARRLARSMGGDLRLDAAPNGGSRFSLVLLAP